MWSVSRGARSAGSSAARSSQRISAISAEGCARQVPGGGEHRGLDVRGGLVGGVGQPDAHGPQIFGRHLDAHFLQQFTRGGLGCGFAGFGLAAGVHELVRAALADGQQAAGVVIDADGGHNNAVFHGYDPSPPRPGARRSTDSRSWFFRGPWTSQE